MSLCDITEQLLTILLIVLLKNIKYANDGTGAYPCHSSGSCASAHVFDGGVVTLRRPGLYCRDAMEQHHE